MVRGFKTGCGRAYRRLVAPLSSQYVATQSQQTLNATQSQQTLKGSHPAHGLLFEPGYNDKVLREYGQLTVWKNYLRDNPRRLLMKREHPDLFRVQRNLMYRGLQFSAIGNRFLLERPERIQVQCSRRLTDEQIDARKSGLLMMARNGAVLVSPCISKGEKQVMRAAFEEGLPLVVLQENGFTELDKPNGLRMEACARGQLLMLAPWDHHNEKVIISRDQCMELNDMARIICENGC